MQRSGQQSDGMFKDADAELWSEKTKKALLSCETSELLSARVTVHEIEQDEAKTSALSAPPILHVLPKKQQQNDG